MGFGFAVGWVFLKLEFFAYCFPLVYILKYREKGMLSADNNLHKILLDAEGELN